MLMQPMLFMPTLTAVEVPHVTMEIRGSEGTPYDGKVSVIRIEENGFSSNVEHVFNGILNMESSDFSGYDYMLIVPETSANSQLIDIGGIDPLAENDLGIIALQTPVVTGTIKNYENVVATTDSALQIQLNVEGDKLNFEIQSLEGLFALAPMTDNRGDELTMTAMDYDVTPKKVSLPKTTNFLATKALEFACLQDEGSGYETPNETGIDYVTVEVLASDNGEHQEGTKVFVTSSGQNQVYLPENLEDSYINITAYDSEDQEVDTNSMIITLGEMDGYGTEPIVNGMVVSTGEVSGGYGDRFESVLSIDSYSTRIGFNTYKGTLGLLNVTLPDGTPFDGYAAYSITYSTEDGSTGGSHSNGEVMNGIIPIPVMSGLTNLAYAYLTISPEVTFNDVGYANSELTDVMDKMTLSGTEFLDLGSVNFQIATTVISVEDIDGQLWDEGSATYTVSRENEVGEDLDVVDFVYSSSPLVEGQLFLAPFGHGMSTQWQLSISNWGNHYFPIETEVFDVALSGTLIERSVYIAPTMTGRMLMPDGLTLLPEGNGNDKMISVWEMDGDYYSESIYENFFYDSIYKVYDLVEGKTYEIEFYLDMGDFDDIGAISPEKLLITYSAVQGTYEGTYVESGRKFTYMVDAEGTINLDVIANEIQLDGHVLKNGVKTNGLEVYLYNDSIQDKIYGRSHSTKSDTGYYGFGPMFGYDVNSSFTIEVAAPSDDLMYSGIVVEDVTFPGLADLDIELPTTDIMGNLLVDVGDTQRFEDNFKRVYVNVFDKDGNYIKNGRVRIDGKFSVGQLPSGRYYAEAFISAYSPLAGEYVGSDKIPFEVVSGTPVEFDLLLNKVLDQGTLSDGSGNGVVDGWVTVYTKDNAYITAISTDDQGQYYLPELADGMYKIRGSKGDLFSAESKTVDITVENEAVIGNLDLVVTPIQVIGQVNQPEGSSVTLGLSYIHVYDADMNIITSAQANGSEYFNLYGLNQEVYFIQAVPQFESEQVTQSALIELDLTNHDLSQTNEFNIELAGPDVSGNVYNPSGQVVSSGWVHLFENNIYHASAQIHSNGSFAFGELDASKTYYIYADASGSDYIDSDQLIVSQGNTGVEMTYKQVADAHGRNISGDVIEAYLYDNNNEGICAIKPDIFGELGFNNLKHGAYKFVLKTMSGYREGSFDFDGSSVDLGDI